MPNSTNAILSLPPQHARRIIGLGKDVSREQIEISIKSSQVKSSNDLYLLEESCGFDRNQFLVRNRKGLGGWEPREVKREVFPVFDEEVSTYVDA